MTNENKTTLRLEIDKTIQPQQYEPIKIQVSVEESFYWENEKDRAEKMQFYTKRITEDFVKSFDHTVTMIGEKGRCIGRVTSLGKNSTSSNEKLPVSSNEDEEFDFS